MFRANYRLTGNYQVVNRCACFWRKSNFRLVHYSPATCRSTFIIPTERVEMLSKSTANSLIRTRNVLCCLFLVLAVFCEAYTVLAIALDRFVPAWYRALGWFLLIAPGALAVGLLLIYANRKRLAFCLSAASLSLYAMLLCLETFRSHVEPGDWIFFCGWLTFCAVGILAARFLSRSVMVDRADVQEYSS
jgi:sorbitol-specific phosphotransferase system component IIC